MNRRSTLRFLGGAVGAAGMAGCAGGDGGGTPTPMVERETVIRERTVVREETVVKEATPRSDLVGIHSIKPEGDITIPPYLYSINEGVWRQHGIDLSLEVAAFPKSQRSIVAGFTPVDAQQPLQIRLINKGEDLVFFGTELNLFGRMFARADDDSIQAPPDLADKVLGVPFAQSLGTVSWRAFINDEYGFDILDDTERTVASPPPAIWNLFLEGELDAVAQFSGFTIKALSQPDQFKTIFDPYQFWVDRTGRPAQATLHTARRSWLEDNPLTALRYLEAWRDAAGVFSDNAAEALRNYGRLAGITTEEEAAVVQDLIEDGVAFGPGMDEEQVDSLWEFVTIMMEQADAFETLPDKDQTFVSRTELEEMAAE